MFALKTTNGRVIHEQQGELTGADLQALTLRGVALAHEDLTGRNFSHSPTSPMPIYVMLCSMRPR